MRALSVHGRGGGAGVMRGGMPYGARVEHPLGRAFDGGGVTAGRRKVGEKPLQGGRYALRRWLFAVLGSPLLPVCSRCAVCLRAYRQTVVRSLGPESVRAGSRTYLSIYLAEL